MIRHLLVAAFLLIAAAAPSLAADQPAFPALTGRVVDQAGILPPEAVSKLTGELAAHEQRTGQQVVVAIVKSLDGRVIEDYGYQLGRFWGIGQKDKNTGAILLVAPADHKVRIEVGYGLEGDLTDAVSSTIINQTILPSFRKGDMANGIVVGTEQMLVALGDNLAVASPAPSISGPSPKGGADDPLGTAIGLAIFMMAGIGVCIWALLGGGRSTGVGVSTTGSSWSSRSSSDSDSSFSGGGGSFGGGGASGSW